MAENSVIVCLVDYWAVDIGNPMQVLAASYKLTEAVMGVHTVYNVGGGGGGGGGLDSHGTRSARKFSALL